MKTVARNCQVSIIIPTFNEQEHISTCLASLYEQNHKYLEVIVVDDGSSDQTIKLVSDSFKQAPKQFQTKLLQQKHLGPGAARNKAAALATGDILVFVDADMTFEPDFIDNLTRPIREGKTIGTFSKEEYVANMDNPWARAWSVLRGFQAGRMHPPDYPDEQPVFRAVTKGEFEQVGGFDVTRGYDDDWSLAERIGALAVNAPRAKFFHHNPGSLTEIWTQAKWVAKRRYKLGVLGQLLTLLKLNVFFSSLRGLSLMLTHGQVHFLIAQLVYDLAQTTGILEQFLTGSKYK